jgi:hypothetical protein
MAKDKKKKNGNGQEAEQEQAPEPEQTPEPRPPEQAFESVGEVMAEPVVDVAPNTYTRENQIADSIDALADTDNPEEIEDACTILKKKVNILRRTSVIERNQRRQARIDEWGFTYLWKAPKVEDSKKDLEAEDAG